MRRIMFILLTVFMSYSNANADGITILSQTHHVWGSSGDETYNETSGHLISASAYGYDPYSDSWVESTASAGDFTIDLAGGLWSAGAFGESTYTFTADSDMLTLSASGYVRQTHGLDEAFISIFDLTDSITIFDYTFRQYWNSSGYWIEENFDFTENISINSDHFYQLYLYTEATGGDSTTESFLTTSISAQPVPEPGTMLFFGTGLALFCGSRVRRKK